MSEHQLDIGAVFGKAVGYSLLVGFVALRKLADNGHPPEPGLFNLFHAGHDLAVIERNDLPPAVVNCPRQHEGVRDFEVISVGIPAGSGDQYQGHRLDVVGGDHIGDQGRTGHNALD